MRAAALIAFPGPAYAPTTTSTIARGEVTQRPVPASHSVRQLVRPPGGTWGCEAWRANVARYSWPVDAALGFMWRESHCDPHARNRSGATGLFQVLGGSTDGDTNIAQAFALWSQRGWEPWVCCEG